ncbi:choline/ethanolamine kinase family protein [Aestuariivirga sp.]|uniref:choline/ethanolamine kinase family protein n=1 Tax=Aestuariivirga sp. TaxID=2650926 RepID=UPI0025B894BF|nr:choline/ethanolamine kinase family protein [Aestuariivirga sp.]
MRALSLWKGPVTVTPLKGGVSNASFKVTDSTGSYVARIGGDYPFHQVSREREAVASRAACEAGLSPELVHSGEGLMVLRYIEARTYTEADVRANAAACVDILKRCHAGMGRRITGQGAVFWVFQILRDYGATLQQHGHRLAGEVPRWLKIVDQLETAQAPLPIVFGHHDILPTNFMDDGQRLWLIDWEYGAFGTAMFDLASLAANNSFDAAGETLILERYFETEPSEALWRAFHAMKAASALREAVWGMISELFLAAPGVDYAAYAKEYLGRFDRVHADYLKRYGA